MIETKFSLDKYIIQFRQTDDIETTYGLNGRSKNSWQSIQMDDVETTDVFPSRKKVHQLVTKQL